MEVEIVKSIANSGGAVVCCVVIVVLFLRYLTDLNNSINVKVENAIGEMAREHVEDAQATRLAFQTQLGDLADRVFEIADKTAAIVKENAVAVRGLEEAVRELQNKMK